MTTSTAAAVVTGAPAGVEVAGWLFKTATWSRGVAMFTPANSQITAVPVVPTGFGVIVRVVAAEVLFLAYHKSIIVLAAESTAFAVGASAYALAALSVMLAIVVAPPPLLDAHATTIRFPLPVAGIVQTVAGNGPGPQVSTYTRLICAHAQGELTNSPATSSAKATLRMTCILPCGSSLSKRSAPPGRVDGALSSPSIEGRVPPLL